VSVQKIFGNLKPNFEKFNMKFSHTGTRYVFASKAIGVYISQMGTIAVSDKFGDNEFKMTTAHEIGHFIDNKIGELNGKRWATDDYEGIAGQIAFTFRDNMNKPKSQQTEYINATKECFARALEQFYGVETFGDEAGVTWSYSPMDKFRPFFIADDFVNKEAYYEKLRPLIMEFFQENKDVLEYTYDIDESNDPTPIGNEEELERKAAIESLEALLEVSGGKDEKDIKEAIEAIKVLQGMPIQKMADGGVLDNKLYHGSSHKFDNIILTPATSGESKFLGEGIYISNDREAAESYSQGKYLYEITLSEPLNSLPYMAEIPVERTKDIIEKFKESDDGDLNHLSDWYQDMLDEEEMLWGKDLIKDLQRYELDVNSILIDLGFNAIEAPLNLMNQFARVKPDSSRNINIIKENIVKAELIDAEKMSNGGEIKSGTWKNKRSGKEWSVDVIDDEEAIIYRNNQSKIIPLESLVKNWERVTHKKKEEGGQISTKTEVIETELKNDEVETGKPISFYSLHTINKDKTPDYGERFGQHIEPKGKYLVSVPNSSFKMEDNERASYHYGVTTFKNPLVIEFKNTGATGWKKDLVDTYGKKGKALSKHLIKLGYDGIITKNEESGYVQEIVSLQDTDRIMMADGGEILQSDKITANNWWRQTLSINEQKELEKKYPSLSTEQIWKEEGSPIHSEYLEMQYSYGDLTDKELWKKIQMSKNYHKDVISTDKITLAVLNEHTLGYVNPTQPDTLYILRALISKGATPNYNNNPDVLINKNDNLRLASGKDFDEFGVSFTGFNNPEEYIYNIDESYEEGGELNYPEISSGWSQEWKDAQLDARNYSFLGKKVIELGDYEHTMHGFELQDGARLMIDGDNIWYEDDKNDVLKIQYAASDRDFKRNYARFKDGDQDSIIFPTKKEAQLFYKLLNKYFPFRKKDRKAKLKHTVTQDFKPKTIPNFTNDDFKKFNEKIINLRDYDTDSRNRVNMPYVLKDIKVEKDPDSVYIFSTIEKQDADITDSPYRLSYSFIYDELGNVSHEKLSFGQSVGWGDDYRFLDSKIENHPELVEFIKEIKKMVKPS